MTAIVSAIVIASSWSCVTCTNVMPTSCWIRFSSSCICLRSLRSSAPSGSSRSSTRGRLTSARASATRCCWPPESWRGWRSPSPSSPTSSQHLVDAALRLLASRPLRRRPNATLSKIEQVREQRVALEDGVDVAPVRRQAATSRSPRKIAPSLGCSKPPIMRSVVVLPQPDGPSRAKNEPRGISSEMPSTAATSSKRLTTLSSRTSGVAQPRSSSAAVEDRVCRSTSASLVAGETSAMLWNGVIRTPRLSA